ncbi:MAG: hypothetical protein ACK4N5_16900, partial [Myxococcales bacterium]
MKRLRSRSWLFIPAAMFVGAAAATCTPDPGGGGDMFRWFDASRPVDPDDDAGNPDGEKIPPERCHLNLDRFVTAGTGAKAKQVEAAGELIGGPNAHGKIGDYLLANDRIRVIVQGVDRHIGSSPYGAT